MATFHELSTAQLRQAVHMREQIESLQQKLDDLLGGGAATSAKRKVGRPPGKRTMSAAGRAKIAAAQKARWAKINGKSAPSTKQKKTTAKAPAKTVAKKKGGISAEGRAKLAAAMKARWAAKKKSSASEAA